MSGADLLINKRVYQPLIRPLRPSEVAEILSTHDWQVKQLKFERTQPLHYSGNTFKGYALQARLLSTVNVAYAAIVEENPQARHVMVAYNVAGKIGSCDGEGEYFGDLQIVREMGNQESTNVVIFITRESDRSQIGSKRFEIICNLTKELFQMLANQVLKNCVDSNWEPWAQEPQVVIPPLQPPLEILDLESQPNSQEAM